MESGVPLEMGVRLSISSALAAPKIALLGWLPEPPSPQNRTHPHALALSKNSMLHVLPTKTLPTAKNQKEPDRSNCLLLDLNQ